MGPEREIYEPDSFRTTKKTRNMRGSEIDSERKRWHHRGNSAAWKSNFDDVTSREDDSLHWPTATQMKYTVEMN